MLNENFLLEDFSLTGHSIEEFDAAVEEVDNHTVILDVNSKDMSVLSYIKEDPSAPGRYLFYRMDPSNSPSITNAWNMHIASLNMNALMARGDFSKVIDECIHDAGMAILWQGKAHFISKSVITGKLQGFGLGGDFLATNCHERDLLIARCFATDTPRKIVLREYNKTYKIFSILSAKYKPFSQKVLSDIFRALPTASLGTPVCRGWEITHTRSRIQVEFPDVADELQKLYSLPKALIPGIYMETSDTGDSAVKIQATWRIGASVSLHRTVSRRHIGDFDVNDILTAAQTQIFSEYTKLPETLCDLMAQNITDPSLDLSVTANVNLNKEAISRVIKKAFVAMDITKAIGKKAEAPLRRMVIEEFDPSMAYTAYDFAMCFLSLPERVLGLGEGAKTKLSIAVATAPYIAYPSMAKTTSPIVLAA